VNNCNFLGVNKPPSTSFLENERLNAWLKKKNKEDCVASVNAAGKDCFFQAHNFLHVYLEQLMVRCIGIAVASSPFVAR